VGIRRSRATVSSKRRLKTQITTTNAVLVS
jgi:hypothetical protein